MPARNTAAALAHRVHCMLSCTGCGQPRPWVNSNGKKPMSSVKPNSSQLLGPLTALALLSLAAGNASAQTRQIELGAVVPSSGPFAEWGRTNTVTLQMLEKQVNDAGGVNACRTRPTARPARRHSWPRTRADRSQRWRWFIRKSVPCSFGEIG